MNIRYGTVSSPDRAPDADAAQSPVVTLVERVKEGIRTRRYAPGQRLIEADLAAEHGLRRGPVREALRVLAGDGIVELVPQKGARVRRFDAADLRELLPLLGALMQVTCKLSIAMLTPAYKRELTSAMRRMRAAAAAADAEHFHAAGIEYARILRQAAGNRFLEYLDSKLYAELFYPQVAAAIPVSNWAAHLQHFESMHGALLKGDLDRALGLLDEHERVMLDRLPKPPRR